MHVSTPLTSSQLLLFCILTIGHTYSSSKINIETSSNLTSSNSSTHLHDHVGPRIWDSKNEMYEYYDMTRRKYLFILNQETFERTSHFNGKRPSTRLYSDKDTEKLNEVFGNILGFEVHTFHNERYSTIVEILNGIAAMDHTNTSCICIVILSHGDRGGQIYAADRPYQREDIVAKISNIASLANIPKLFFVQACRGGLGNVGQTVLYADQSELGLAAPSTSAKLLYAGFNLIFNVLRVLCIGVDADDNNPLDRQRVRVETVPIYADVLEVYATVEGYVSYRRKDYGSWMIQTLCEIIREHHKNLDLDDMVRLMRVKVARMSTSSNQKQIIETKTTLLKRVIFASIRNILGGH